MYKLSPSPIGLTHNLSPPKEMVAQRREKLQSLPTKKLDMLAILFVFFYTIVAIVRHTLRLLETNSSMPLPIIH